MPWWTSRLVLLNVSYHKNMNIYGLGVGILSPEFQIILQNYISVTIICIFSYKSHQWLVGNSLNKISVGLGTHVGQPLSPFCLNAQLRIHFYHIIKFQNNPSSGYRDLVRTKFGRIGIKVEE